MDLENRMNIIGQDFVWSTQFNDLRKRKPSREKTLSDLKISYLFHDKSIIRDADLVNHPILIESLIKYPFLYADGALIPALRDSVGSYTELNESAGINRAFPEKYSESVDLLKVFDKELYKVSNQKNQQVVGSLPSKIDVDHFDVLVNRIINDANESHGINTDLINNAKVYASERSEGGFLSFGKMYENLMSHGWINYESKEIQCLRLAHNLVVPIECGLSANITDQKIVKSWMGVLRPNTEIYKESQSYSGFDFEKLSSMYPQLIPSGNSLDNLDFEDIKNIREVEGVSSGYFISLHRLKFAAENNLNIYPSIVDYLDCLKEYLERINMRDSKVVFVNWRKEVEDYFDSRIEHFQAFSMKHGIPIIYRSIVGGVSAMALYSIVPDDQIWTMLAVALGGVAGGFAALPAKLHEDKNKVQIEKIKAYQNMIREDYRCRTKVNF